MLSVETNKDAGFEPQRQNLNNKGIINLQGIFTTAIDHLLEGTNSK